MLNCFTCFRPNLPLESLIREWIDEQPAGNEENLNEARTRILEARSTKSNQLNLAGLGLFTLPPLEKLASHLQILYLDNNKLNALPDSIGGLSNLKRLILYDNQLEKLPNSIGGLSNLQDLTLDRNQLKELPDSIGGLSELERLELKNNKLTELPDSIGGLSNLQELTLDSNQLEKLPNSIGELSNLKRLLLYGNQLKELPNSIGGLSNLERLILYSNKLEELPDSIGDLNNLRELDLAYNKLKKLPDSIGGLSELRTLRLENNQLKELPDSSIGGLSNLQELVLGSNQLEKLPNSIGELSNLKILLLYCNQLKELPNSIGGLSNLQALVIDHNQLEKLPNSIGELSNLERLILHSNKLEELPDSIGELSNLERLILHSNKLEELPDSIGDLNNLRELDLTYNQLEELPNSIGGLSNLQELNLNNNQLKELPDSTGRLSNLKRLILRSNKLEDLPDSIGDLNNLQELVLNSNQLEELPDSIGGLSNLRELHLTYNQLIKLPDSIGRLYNLRRLTILSNQLEELPDSIIRNGALRIYPPQIDISNQSIPAPFIFNTIKAFSKIRANAQFTNQEKSQKATEALKIDYLETNNSGQNLKSKLREIKNSLINSLITQPSERHIEPLTEFLKKLVLEDGSYNRADANSKKLLSRQILEVLLIANDKKGNQEFNKGVLEICQESQGCADRTALYFYYLKNFVNGKTTSELDSMFQKFQHEDSRSASALTSDSQAQEDLNPAKLIEYLKNQATFNYILKMAESKCEEIKKGNPQFSEDVEVYINYLRIFNEELQKAKINSGLPAIQHQMYFNEQQYKPNSSEINFLQDVLKSENKSEIAKFLAQNIRDETFTSMYHALDETKIYKTINLAVCDIASPYMDTDSYEKSQDAVKALETLQKLQKEIVKDEFEEVLLRIIEKQKFKINFDENKTSKIKEKIESTLRKEGLLPKGSVSNAGVAEEKSLVAEMVKRFSR